MSSKQQIHNMTVGDRAHRIVAAILEEGAEQDRRSLTLQATRCARAVFKAHPIDYRPREAFVDAVTAAGVYIHRFLLPTPWEVNGVEVECGRSRLDIVYSKVGTGFLIDEMKLGVGRHGESAVREQIDRYLELGQDTWGSSFVGVRLCAIHEPNQSLLHSPGGTIQLLTKSGLAEELCVR